LLAAWQLAGRRTASVVAVLAVLWAPFAVAQARVLRDNIVAERVTLDEPPVLAGMRVDALRAMQWTRIADALRQYSEARPQWTMLLEGMNVVMLGLAPDRTNVDPYFMRYRGIPYDAELRAAYIIRERPLVFREMQDSAPVDKAMKAVGYVPLARYWNGILLAPRQPPPAEAGGVMGG
jgi:hypothetical protein